MIIKKLSSRIKLLNCHRYDWIVILFCTVIIGAVDINALFDVSFINNSLGLLVALITCINFFNMYLVASITKENGASNGRILSDYVKYHAFPTRDYFKSILKKCMIITVPLFAEYLVFGFVEKSVVKMVVAFAIPALPFVVWKIKLSLFEYELTNQPPLLYLFTNLLFDGVLYLVKLIVIIPTFVWTALTISAFATSRLAPCDSGEIPSVIFTELSNYLLVSFILVVILGTMLLFLSVSKKNIITTAIVAFLVIVLGVTGIYKTTSSYIKITGENIYVVENNNKREYTFDDIKTVLSSEKKVDEDEYSITLKMKDGKTIELGSDYSLESNDSWSDKFGDFDKYSEWIIQNVGGN